MPILGICRGAQALNVACGGTLHQHLPEVAGGAIVHRQADPGCATAHAIDVLAGSRLARVVGSKRLEVNSFHHQAVDRLGAGLRACAHAPDGTIEAIEDPTRRLVLGVQWHAEMLIEGRSHLSLFQELVAEASGVLRLPLAA
jgi:putative glutamine amidotransferase